LFKDVNFDQRDGRPTSVTSRCAVNYVEANPTVARQATNGDPYHVRDPDLWFLPESIVMGESGSYGGLHRCGATVESVT
jgi:hypothetical protein